MTPAKILKRRWWAWRAMIRRCHDPSDSDYYAYGARGIYVCDRWRGSFDLFLEDMGPMPPGMSIDRIDNDGPYSPENCRWASPHQQSRNKRNMVLFEFKGRRLNLSDWSRELGIPLPTLKSRRAKKWPVEMLLSNEKFKGGNRS